MTTTKAKRATTAKILPRIDRITIAATIITFVVLMVVSVVVAAQASDEARAAMRATAAYESRIVVLENSMSRMVFDFIHLDNDLDLVEERLELARKDRDVAHRALEDLRIAIGAVSATQKGRFRSPYLPKWKRP